MIENLITVVSILLGVAFFTFAERKVLASIQRRRGPNVVGFWGVLQAFADGLKLVLKEVIIPVRANWVIFILSPCIAFVVALVIWAFIPYSGLNFLTNFDFSLLFIYAISSIGVYGIILSGWSSNSRYAFLGALRSAAQLISYEVSIGLIILPVALCAGTFNIVEIVNKQIATTWYVLPLLPAAAVFFISILAETNRAPFDLPEAEAEIVAGYNVEYSSMAFALFFLAEYSNMLWLSFLFALCFFGGWGSPVSVLPSSFGWLVIKAMVVCFLIIKVRANYPRYRYDQLMNLGWKCFLPFAIGYFMFIITICLL